MNTPLWMRKLRTTLAFVTACFPAQPCSAANSSSQLLTVSRRLTLRNRSPVSFLRRMQKATSSSGSFSTLAQKSARIRSFCSRASGGSS